MKNIFFSFFVTCIFTKGFSQNYRAIDSLEKILPSLRDSSRVDCLNELSNQYFPHYEIWHNLEPSPDSDQQINKEKKENHSIDSAGYFQQLAYEESTKINYIHGIAEALSYKAEMQDLAENFFEEEKSSKEAIQLFRKAADKKRLAKTYENLSNALRSLSAFDESIKNLDTAYELYLHAADTGGMARVLSVSGTIYEERGDYVKAFQLGTESLVLGKQIKDEWFIKWQTESVGGLFEAIEDYATALEYFRVAHQNTPPKNYGVHFLELLCLNQKYDSAQYYYKLIVEDTSDQRSLRFYLGRIANYYYMQKQYDKAFSSFLRFLDYSRKFNDRNQTMYALIGIAKTYLALKNYSGALAYAQQSLDFAKRAGSKRVIQDALQIIYAVYDHRQQTDSAYSYYKQYTVMKDSLLNNQIKGKLTAFRSEQKSEQQIALLNKEKEIQVVQLQKQSLQNKMLIGGVFVFLLIAFILWRNNRHKQKAYELIQLQKKETEIQKTKAEQTLEELKSTQSQLIQSEKMASLGELTAGIAHEIQNPLNFVNNFSEVSIELITEMKQELQAGNKNQATAIATDISNNLEKVIHHGKRADSIVKGMLQHSRASNGQKEMTDINELADEYLRLSYQGLRAKKKSFNATIKTDFDENIGKINIVPQDVGRALLNLYNNAFYSVSEKKSKLGTNYEPVVTVITKKMIDKIEIHVRDNGIGIPQKALGKIFQPFFTTKPTGQGTGLGLSLTYDIVTKEHGGMITVETKEGEFAEFIILLPGIRS